MSNENRIGSIDNDIPVRQGVWGRRSNEVSIPDSSRLVPSRESGTLDAETVQAMKEVSDAMLHRKSTDINGNPIMPETLSYSLGEGDLPTSAVILIAPKPEPQG